MDDEPAQPVLVIGGGLTGVGIARDLAMRGIDVVLVERGFLGQETSTHTHGVLHSGARYADEDPEAATDCIQENTILKELAPHAIKDTGGVFVSLEQDSDDYFETKKQACRDCGIPALEIDADTALERYPYLSENVEKALEVPDAVFNPVMLLKSTVASALQYGADIRVNTVVRGMTVKTDGVAYVTLEHEGEKRNEGFSHIVNASGAWADQVAATAGIEVDMQPTCGAMTVVNEESVDVVVNRCRETSDGDIIVPYRDTAILGTTSHRVDDPDTFVQPPGEDHRLVDETSEMVPAVEHADIDRTYWGVRPLHASSETARNASRRFFILDHAEDDIPNISTVVGGKITTYRLMAEKVGDHVCDKLGINAACETAENPLPEPGKLKYLVDDLVWPPQY